MGFFYGYFLHTIHNNKSLSSTHTKLQGKHPWQISQGLNLLGWFDLIECVNKILIFLNYRIIIFLANKIISSNKEVKIRNKSF